MAKIVMKNALVEIGSSYASTVSLSNRAKTVRIRVSLPSKDTTCFGDTWETAATGIGSWTASVIFIQDYAATGLINSVNSALEDMAQNSSASTVKFRADSAATSATNPTYAGTAWLTDYEPIAGSLGEVLGITANFKGTGALVKYTG